MGRRDLPVLDADPRQDWVPTDVHDWERRETNVLVLNYTMKCALKCDFCCYGCHPGRSETMPVAEAIRLVREAADLGVFSSVGFTGGECMLFYEELLQVGDVLADVGLPFTIATAAHWATSPSVASSMVGELQKRGLNRLNVSHDPSHAQFVPREHVINAAMAASSAGIGTYLVGTFYTPGESLRSFLPELTDVPFVRMVDKLVGKVGRAAKRDITQETYGLSLKLDNLACYRRRYHDLVVFYDGRTYPCCSTFNRATPGIAIGDAFTEPLRDLWERTEGSLMLRVMKREGFAEFYRIVERYDPELRSELPDAARFAGPCGLCNALFRRPELTSRLKGAFEAYERDQVGRTLDAVVALLGEERAVGAIADAIAQ